MLKASPAFPSFSVDNLDAAKKFYGGTLGIEVKEITGVGVLELHTNGNSPIILYPKDDHEPSTYTVLNFKVDDIAQRQCL
jgi:catechol 2,3-dioxygenase-like lactoylglutathione lyase family enzyme